MIEMPDELEILFERHEGGHCPQKESQWLKVTKFVQKSATVEKI